MNIQGKSMAVASWGLGVVCVHESSLIQSLWAGGMDWVFEDGGLELVQSYQESLLFYNFLL